jgi:hypothetical protein
MRTITLEFETEELAEEFRGWYYDGGGCDSFTDALSLRNVVVNSEFCQVRLVDKSVFTHNVKTA